jgi:hypothetical protein
VRCQAADGRRVDENVKRREVCHLARDAGCDAWRRGLPAQGRMTRAMGFRRRSAKCERSCSAGTFPARERRGHRAQAGGFTLDARGASALH